MSLNTSEWRVLKLLELVGVYVAGPGAGGTLRIGVSAHPWEAVQRLRKADPDTIMHHLAFAADKHVALRLKREALARLDPTSRIGGDGCTVEPNIAIQAMQDAARRIGGGIWGEDQVRTVIDVAMRKRLGSLRENEAHAEYAKREALATLMAW